MTSSASSSDEFEDIDIEELTGQKKVKRRRKTTDYSSLNEKTKQLYEIAYENYLQWRNKEKTVVSENSLLEYFEQQGKRYKPKSLWAQYSMLKNTLRDKEQIDISDYVAVTSYLKKISRECESKSDNLFTADNVKKFLYEAPDDIYLLIKVVLIFGIVGACRSTEIVNLTLEDVEEEGELLLVKIPKTKIYKSRSFIISREYTKIIQKYKALRPERVTTNRFFLNFQHGKCLRKVIGKNKIASMAKDIASYLQLENPERYTGHAFRRTSATLYGDPTKNILYL